MTDKAAEEKRARDDPTQGSPLTRLAAAVGATKTRGPAPVHLWHPPYCGEIAMRIATDGTWFYDGSPINRPAMVALFAAILRKDPDRHVLVTPVECVGIAVDDAPFVAVAMEAVDGALRFATNLGDEVEAGRDHALRFTVAPDGGVKPYVHIRGDLWARLTRTLAIDLLDRTVEATFEGTPTIGVPSAGEFFPIGAAAAPP